MSTQSKTADLPPLLRLSLPGGIPMEFVLIQAGEFFMGTRGGEYESEEPRHLVRVPGFYLGKYPVTQAQFLAWQADFGFAFSGNPTHPAENLDWHQAVAFAQWVQEQCGEAFPEGFFAHLPTEIQWEYACRAGTDTDYHTGDGEAALETAGWYRENSGSTTHPVGEKLPNAWGLHDMHGNVWEWCRDIYDSDAYRKRPYLYEEEPLNATARYEDAEKAPHRVHRGGSCIDSASYCRSADRLRWHPGNRNGDQGFRLALVPGSGGVSSQVQPSPAQPSRERSPGLEPGAREERKAEVAGGAAFQGVPLPPAPSSPA